MGKENLYLQMILEQEDIHVKRKSPQCLSNFIHKNCFDVDHSHQRQPQVHTAFQKKTILEQDTKHKE